PCTQPAPPEEPAAVAPQTAPTFLSISFQLLSDPRLFNGIYPAKIPELTASIQIKEVPPQAAKTISKTVWKCTN
ncbi:MAG: hypothetical protein WB424_14270, partial [Terracidiphilus sp.]